MEVKTTLVVVGGRCVPGNACEGFRVNHKIDPGPSAAAMPVRTEVRARIAKDSKPAQQKAWRAHAGRFVARKRLARPFVPLNPAHVRHRPRQLRRFAGLLEATTRWLQSRLHPSLAWFKQEIPHPGPCNHTTLWKELQGSLDP